MRQSFRGVIGLTVIGALALGGMPRNVFAGKDKALPSLLGIRVLHDTWRTVLAKYGQPTRIEIGAPTAQPGGQAGMGMPGMMAGRGGLPGMPGLGPMSGGPGGMGGSAMMAMRGGMGRMGMMGGQSMAPSAGMGRNAIDRKSV